MATPAAVIFDNDGLLLDTESVWTRGERDLFARRGREFTPPTSASWSAPPPRTARAILARQLDEPGREPELIAELDELVFDELERGVEPMAGALELVAELRAPRRADRRRLELAGAVHRPGAGAGRARPSASASSSAATTSRRRSRRPTPTWRPASSSASQPAPDVIVLEDSPTGVAAGRAAGLTVLGVPSLDGIELDEADEVFASLGRAGRCAARLGLT